MSIKFKILGIPQPKQSARFAIRKGKGGRNFLQKYQKKEVVQNERNIAFDIKSQLPEGFIPFDSAIHVKKLLYVFPPQKNWSKKKLKELEEGKIFYKETKPDLTDNLNKGLFDAMNGIVYTDDARICKMSEVEKIYGLIPRIEVEFEILN